MGASILISFLVSGFWTFTSHKVEAMSVDEYCKTIPIAQVVKCRDSDVGGNIYTAGNEGCKFIAWRICDDENEDQKKVDFYNTHKEDDQQTKQTEDK